MIWWHPKPTTFRRLVVHRVNAVLKKLKKELKGYEKAIRAIEDRNDGQPKHWYMFRKLI